MEMIRLKEAYMTALLQTNYPFKEVNLCDKDNRFPTVIGETTRPKSFFSRAIIQVKLA
jgi:hypothetical protein